MVQRVITQLVDDIDGKELTEGKGETVAFAIDGTSYEIDLSNKNADAFRGLFQDYIAAGRKVGRKQGSKARSSTSSTGAGGPSAAEIRDWARSNGMQVPDRGRIPSEVREAYNTAD